MNNIPFIAIIGGSPRSGKTTASKLLAKEFNESGRPTAVIDKDAGIEDIRNHARKYFDDHESFKDYQSTKRAAMPFRLMALALNNAQSSCNTLLVFPAEKEGHLFKNMVENMICAHSSVPINFLFLWVTINEQLRKNRFEVNRHDDVTIAHQLDNWDAYYGGIKAVAENGTDAVDKVIDASEMSRFDASNALKNAINHNHNIIRPDSCIKFPLEKIIGPYTRRTL